MWILNGASQWGWQDLAGGWLGMGLMMAIVWLPLIAGGFWLLQLLSRGPGGVPPRDDLDARELARRAYARGEMDRERFLQVMQDLETHAHRPA